MEKQTIGAFLQTLRKAKGYTQQEVADALGISNRTLSAWENDKAYPDLLSIPVLADMYGVTSDEILRGERKNSETSAAEEISAKSERAVLKNRLVKFNTQNYILTIIISVAAVLMVTGLFLTYPWGLVLIIISAIADITAFILRTVFYKNDKIKAGISPDEEITDEKISHHKNIRATLRKCFLTEGGMLLPAGAVLFIIAAVNGFYRYNALYYCCMALALAAALTLFIYSLAASQADILKWGKESQKAAVTHNRALAKKCVLGGGVPFILGVLILTTFLLPPFDREKQDFGGTFSETKEYMQVFDVAEDGELCLNYGAEAAEYYFDLPLPDSSEDVHIELDGGFSADIKHSSTICYIYYNPLSESDPLCKASLLLSDENGYIWNVRYAEYLFTAAANQSKDKHEVHTFYTAESGYSRYIKADGENYAVYHIVSYDIFMPWWSYMPLLSLSFLVPLVIYLAKRKSVNRR